MHFCHLYSVLSQKIKLLKLESEGSLLPASLLGIVALGCSAASRLWVSSHQMHGRSGQALLNSCAVNRGCVGRPDPGFNS